MNKLEQDLLREEEKEEVVEHKEGNINKLKTPRFYVFIIFSFCAFSDYYLNYFLQTLEAPLLQKFGLSVKMYNILVSSNSIPNFIFPFIIGIVMDKFGLRLIFLIGATIFFLSQILVSLGLYFLNFYLLLLGRLIYGMSSEILAIGKVKS